MICKKNVKLCILLSTYNGEKYLKEQLESLKNQTYKNFEIIARDDGSSDKTVEILKKFNINLIKSDSNVGAKLSFSLLLEYAIKNTNAHYFMFCDQDDFWYENKIELSYKKIKELEKSKGKDCPILVHTDLEVVDEELNLISESFWKYQKINPKHNNLNRLLMQNTITGCTTIFNRKLAFLSLDIPKEAIMHDWWIGLIATTFGEIFYIEDKTIKYRQHSNNEIGAIKYNFTNDFGKKLKLISSRNINILEKNIIQSKAFFTKFDNFLKKKQSVLLKKYILLNGKLSYLEKMSIIFKYKFFKQGFLRNILILLKI